MIRSRLFLLLLLFPAGCHHGREKDLQERKEQLLHKLALEREIASHVDDFQSERDRLAERISDAAGNCPSSSSAVLLAGFEKLPGATSADLQPLDQGASKIFIKGDGAPAAAVSALHELWARNAGCDFTVSQVFVAERSWSVELRFSPSPDSTPTGLPTVPPPAEVAPAGGSDLAVEVAALEREEQALAPTLARVEALDGEKRALQSRLDAVHAPDRLAPVLDAVDALFAGARPPLASGTLEIEKARLVVRGALAAGGGLDDVRAALEPHYAIKTLKTNPVVVVDATRKAGVEPPPEE